MAASFNVIKITENTDGSATMEYEVNDEFKQVYLKATGKKRVTIAGLNKWVLKSLRAQCEAEGLLQEGN